MNHLTDEQFEDVMQGESAAHLDECEQCQAKLAEKKAIAARLRSAFDSVQADDELEGRILKKLGMVAANAKASGLLIHRRRMLWSALAAAAVILILVLPSIFYLSTPRAAKAAKAGLARIHQHNISSHKEFYSDSEPAKVAKYLKDNLGFTTSLPAVGKGMAVRQCCQAHFKGSIVGSYVVGTPRGVISIIIVTDTPESMGMKRTAKGRENSGAFWEGSFAMCDMVAAQIGDYSFCAVAEIPHEYLRELLGKLLSDD